MLAQLRHILDGWTPAPLQPCFMRGAHTAGAMAPTARFKCRHEVDFISQKLLSVTFPAFPMTSLSRSAIT